MDTDIRIKIHTLIEENYIPKIEQRFQYYLQKVFNIKSTLPAITTSPSAIKCDTGYPFSVNCANICTLRATAYPSTNSYGTLSVDRFNVSGIGNTSSIDDFIEDVAVHLAIKYLHSHNRFLEEAVLTFLQKEVGTTAISEIFFDFLNVKQGRAELEFKIGIIYYCMVLGNFDKDGSRIIEGHYVDIKKQQQSSYIDYYLPEDVKGVENSVDIDEYVKHLAIMYRMLNVLAIYPYKD